MDRRAFISAVGAAAALTGVSAVADVQEPASNSDGRFKAVGASQPTSFVDLLVEAIDFRSGVNGRDYSLWIHKPQSYSMGSNRYPVMILLDAESAFGMASDIAQLQAAWSRAPTGQSAAPIPEVILVGVALPGTPPDPFRRNFEFSPPGSGSNLSPSQSEYIEKVKTMLGRGPTFGGAAEFLRVLQEEILPAIDRHYRTDPTPRILFGSSASGTFCAFTLFTQPDLFTDYIVASPAIPEAIFRMEAAWAEKHDDLKARLLLTVGEREVLDPINLFSETARLSEVLQYRKYPGLRLETWFIDRASHVETQAPSIARGLARLAEQ